MYATCRCITYVLNVSKLVWKVSSLWACSMRLGIHVGMCKLAGLLTSGGIALHYNFFQVEICPSSLVLSETSVQLVQGKGNMSYIGVCT